uniref:ZP domain-containing protein n=1 Tax=Strigamia maritima TaxID=126957 RepID=T1IJ92_STRMM
MQYDLAHMLFFATTYAVVMGQNETSSETSAATNEATNEVTSRTTSLRQITTNATFSSEESREAHESKVIYYDNPFESFSGKPPPGYLPGETATETALRWPAPDPPGTHSMNKTRVYDIDAECQNDYMKIAITFNGSFNGLIYTSSYAYDPTCVYVNGTGSYRYDFLIQLNKCGTLNGGSKDLTDDKKYMWNTLTVQYNPLIEEEWDEHFKVTCEYGYDFWKTISFPVVDVQIATGNPLLFTLTPPECYMEIRQGFGLTGPRIGGPVAVGDPLTLIIYMRSQTTGFDVIINNCVAHNGGHKRMFLIDKHGCPVDEKLISEFRGKDFHGGVYETQVFAYFKAFRFTGSPALYIECDVRMCHGICPKQRCYWRSIQKRSIADTNDNITVSDTLKMFQSLDVRTEKQESTNSGYDENDFDPNAVCFRPAGLAAIFSLLLILLLVSSGISCILCARMRRLRGGSTKELLKTYSHSDFAPKIHTQNETELSISNEVPTPNPQKHLIIDKTSSEESEEMHFEHRNNFHENARHLSVETSTSENPTTPEPTTSEEAFSEKTHEETIHEETTHEETTHKETTHKETTHEETTHEETTHEETTHEETTHEETTHEETTHEETTHEETTHEETTHEEISHEETSHEETTPEETTTEPATSELTTPEFVPDIKSVGTALRWPPPDPPESETSNTTRVYDIDAECQNDSMRISITFNGSFNGLIYTTSYASDPACIYVNGTGLVRYDFLIQLNKCGTLNGGPKEKEQKEQKKYMWNTLTVQYNPLIEEDRDEHFEVTCEYGYDFWKTVSFPVVEVQAISEKIATGRLLHFTLSPPECYMEIKQGYGLTGEAIHGSVAVGDPLTLVIHMRSKITGFDVIINNCVAHDGGHKRMFLIDKHGCPVDEKLISEFRGKDFHGGVYETQVFAYFKAFRFTGSPALYLECD